MRPLQAGVLMEVLLILRAWMLVPLFTDKKSPDMPRVACLSDKETVLFLQRLASLARAEPGAMLAGTQTYGAQGHDTGTKTPQQRQWEAIFLDLVHTLCTARGHPQVCSR